METQAFFEKIQDRIIEEILNAKSSIHIAVAWFTDNDIFDAIYKKAKEGVRVELMIANDSINRNSGIQYHLISDIGGLFLMVGDIKKNESLMHNKFCVIDNKNIITGSYNWSKKAQKNSENITIVSDADELASQFIKEFNKLVEKYSIHSVGDVDILTIIKRLNILKEMIEIKDKDDIDSQISKFINIINKLQYNNNLYEIVNFIKNGNYDIALNKIDTFIDLYTSITIYNDPEISELNLELKSLEIQVGVLEEEKVEIEKLLHTYNHRHNIEVGEIIRQILLLRRELLKKQAFNDKEKEQKYEEAKQDYENFEQDYNDSKEMNICDVTEAEKLEIKAIFRACCKICHPDVVSEEFKQDANAIFIKLKNSYDKNDISSLKSLYENLKSGKFTLSSSQKIKINQLLNRVVILRGKVKELSVIIYNLMSSEAYRTIISIENWDDHFKDLKIQLFEELNRLKNYKIEK